MKKWAKGSKITSMKELWDRLEVGGRIFLKGRLIEPKEALTWQSEFVKEVVEMGQVFQAIRVDI